MLQLRACYLGWTSVSCLREKFLLFVLQNADKWASVTHSPMHAKCTAHLNK